MYIYIYLVDDPKNNGNCLAQFQEKQKTREQTGHRHMILSYIFRLGLRGHVLIEASQIPRTFARGARKRSRDLSCFYKYISSKSKTKYIV